MSKFEIRVRKHPFGFLIIQNQDDKFGKDNSYIFLNSHKLYLCDDLLKLKEELKEKMNNKKKLHDIDRLAKKGSDILKELNLKSNKLLVNSRFNDCYFKLTDYYIKVSKSSDDFTLKPFNAFVFNNCLFGTYFRGKLLDGDIINLVDHHLNPTSPIVEIIVDSKFHVYEKIIFINFNNHISYLKKLSDKNLTIYYHLPILDYVLSMLLLRIKDKLEPKAFAASMSEIIRRGRIHQQNLQKIAEKSGVKIIFLSSFNNLINPKHNISALELLKIIGEPTNEQQLVSSVISLLKTNSFSPILQEVWVKLANQVDFVQTLNELLEYANAAIIAYARLASSQKDTIGVWLATEESPVYKTYKNKMRISFGEVACFCYLPSYLNYTEMTPEGKNQKSLFYYNSQLQDPFDNEDAEIPPQFSWQNLQKHFCINSPRQCLSLTTQDLINILIKCSFYSKRYNLEAQCQIHQSEFTFFFEKSPDKIKLVVQKNCLTSYRYDLFSTDKPKQAESVKSHPSKRVSSI